MESNDRMEESSRYHSSGHSVPGSPNYTCDEARETVNIDPLLSFTSLLSLKGQPSEQGCELTSNFQYHSKSNNVNILSVCSALRRSNNLCDVSIRLEHYPKTIRAHKVVLAAFSPYFRAMFTFPCLEASQEEITLREIDGPAFEAIIDFCYESHITFSSLNVQSILQVSFLLQIEELQNVACDYIRAHLDVHNSLGILNFAQSLGFQKLIRAAENYIFVNFLNIVQCDEFLHLSADQLARLIRSDELRVTSEEHVYHALMKWLNFSLDDRKPQLSALLQHIRMPLLSPKFLVGTVGADAIIRSDERCRDLLDEAKNYLLLPQERAQMQGPRTRARKMMSDGEILFAVGGWCCGDAISSVERCLAVPMKGDRAARGQYKWQKATPMATPRCGVGVAVMGELLYAVGGHDGRHYVNTVERYDPYTNCWSSDLCRLSNSRTSCGVEVVNRNIYAVGGQDGHACLDLVERFDPITNCWTFVAPMSTPRLGLGVGVINGILYAVGGSNGTNPLSSAEMFDPRLGKWQPIVSMFSRRKHLGVTCHDGILYACGGRDDSTELPTIEWYDPRANAWSSLLAMSSRRSGVATAVLDSQLVVVGGFDGRCYLKSVESYDFVSKSWQSRGSMNWRRLGCGVGVLRVPALEMLPNYEAEPSNRSYFTPIEQSEPQQMLDLTPTPTESSNVFLLADADDTVSIDTDYSLGPSISSTLPVDVTLPHCQHSPASQQSPN